MNEDDKFTIGLEESSHRQINTKKHDNNESFAKERTDPIDKTASNGNPSDKYSYKTVYSYFVKSKTDPTMSYEQYLKTKPEVYLLFGLKPFQPLPDNILESVTAFKNRCFSDIDRDLTSSNELIEKGEQIKKCLYEIENIFKYYDSEESNFEEALRQNQYEKLLVILREKEFDGAIELSEIESLLKVAKQLYLWDGKSTLVRQEVLNWIKEKALEDECRIESYTETFVRIVKNKPPLEKLKVPVCIEKLYMEFRVLKYTELEIYDQKLEIDEQELHEEMIAILDEKKLLRDNEEAYLNDFFNIEKARSGKDYTLKLQANYFQYLKTIATSTYYFSETQWVAFAKKQGLSSLNDVSAAFILGTEKASSIENISNLLENNKTKAIERIIDGDLETYLIHVGQRKMADEISHIKINYKDNNDSIFTNVINILRGINDTTEENSVEIDDRQSLLALINRNAPIKEMVQYLLKRKTREKLNQRILGESNDRNDLDKYLMNNNISFVCLCMNYLHEFPNESNSSGYTNIYEMYANYVLDILIKKNAYNLFYSGFKPLIQLDFVSQAFKDKLNQTSINMQKDFESFFETVNKKNKSKSLFSFR